MVDRLISIALNLTIMGLITALAAASLICGHTGLLRILEAAPGRGAPLLGAAAASAVAALLVIRYRNDLVDRQ